MFKRKMELAMGLLMIMVVASISGRAAQVADMTAQMKEAKYRVVIDPGHGGNDPGKVGVDGSLEKDINLSIALKLKEFLEASDVEVAMTRENGQGLYKETDSKKKMADMNKRCDIINDFKPDVVISIHQNSYHQEGVSGAQVFYYKGSQKGELLADLIQERFTYVMGDKNTRVSKANDNYYLLLHVKSPIVIVECGFLSNWNEAALLGDKIYQEKVAWTIHIGVMEYLNQKK